MKRSAFAAGAVMVLGALSVLVPVARAATPVEDTCLEPARLYRWNVLDDRTLIVTDKVRHDYKVSLEPGCYDLKFTQHIDFRPFSPSKLSCLGNGDAVVVPADGGTPRQYCRISSVIPYTAEMQHADAVAKALDKPH